MNSKGQPKKYTKEYYDNKKQIKDEIPIKDHAEVRKLFKAIKNRYLIKKKGKA